MIRTLFLNKTTWEMQFRAVSFGTLVHCSTVHVHIFVLPGVRVSAIHQRHSAASRNNNCSFLLLRQFVTKMSAANALTSKTYYVQWTEIYSK